VFLSGRNPATARLILGGHGREDLFGSFACYFSLGEQEGHGLCVGVRSTVGAFEPQLLVLDRDAGDAILVGFDTEIVGLSKDDLRIVFRIEFESYVRSMHFLRKMGTLVIEEIGVSLVSFKGERIWSVLRDVITEIRLLNQQELHLAFMDSGPIVIEIHSGVVKNA